MENKKENNLGVTVTVTGQTRLVLTGATAVEGVTENAVTATLPAGKFTVRGKGLKVLGFSEMGGELTVAGELCDFSFSGRKTSFIKKVFQ